MRILFITPGMLSYEVGYLARFLMVLSFLEKKHEVFVLSLGEKSEKNKIKREFKRVTFFHFPAKYRGWSVTNLNQVVEYVGELNDKNKFDLAVLHVEVWDLMRGLGYFFEKKIPFATILHAMPFLGSPLKMTKNFEKDVLDYCKTNISGYRKKYFLKHYSEVHNVFGKIEVIANNKTIENTFKNYFPNKNIRSMFPVLVGNIKCRETDIAKTKYDFVYMARMEMGKGVEYLDEIISNIYETLGRPLSLAIVGRTDDRKSEKSLEKLLKKYRTNKDIKIKYFGWADNNKKKKILSESGVFLYPSVYDNYPTVLNEAIMCGLPSVIWDVPYADNYKKYMGVKIAPYMDFKSFSRLAVDMLKGKEKISNKIFSQLQKSLDPKKVAVKDENLFIDIVKKYGKNIR